jgi:hypothetical protein
MSDERWLEMAEQDFHRHWAIRDMVDAGLHECNPRMWRQERLVFSDRFWQDMIRMQVKIVTEPF